MQHDALARLIDHWKSDPHSTYKTWFLWDERLKNFRSIRRGIGQVVREIETGTFGNTYRGSSLQTVVGSVAEQRQIFKGADHAFLWKPKLRIPDIYENPDNQRAFARLLHTCDCCDSAEAIIEAIRRIDTLGIKGLGPAVANLLYFIHPTLVVPFNTAIVNGFNALTGGKVKLGRWDHYLSMREGALRLNERYQSRLSNDLGAIAGLMFDVGSGRYAAPPQAPDTATLQAWEADLQRVREESAAAQRQWLQERESDATHTEIQGWLRDLGIALGFHVWIAANDRSRMFGEGRLFGRGSHSASRRTGKRAGFRAFDRRPVDRARRAAGRGRLRGRTFDLDIFGNRAHARSCARNRTRGPQPAVLGRARRSPT